MAPAAAYIASAAGARREATVERGARLAAERAASGGAAAAPPGTLGGGGFSGSSHVDADGVLELGVDRTLLLAVLKARRRRAAQCRSLPLAVLAYCIFLWALTTHVRVPQHFAAERGCVARSIFDARATDRRRCNSRCRRHRRLPPRPTRPHGLATARFRRGLPAAAARCRPPASPCAMPNTTNHQPSPQFARRSRARTDCSTLSSAPLHRCRRRSGWRVCRAFLLP